MAKRVSPTAIGTFVVASFAILVVVLVVVGSGKLFQKPITFVCMFQGDLNGLKVGAPVKVRGVQIGTVSAIKLKLAPSEGAIKPEVRGLRLPVFIELDRSLLTERGGTGEALGKAGFQDMMQRGMRAQLNVESLLTGLLFINLDLHPGSPVDLVLVPGSGRYQEIPTIPTKLEAVQEQVTKALADFDKIDFQAMAASITEAANSIKGFASSPELKATLIALQGATKNLNQTLTSVRATVDNANGRIGPLVAHLQRNSDQVNLTLTQTRAAIVQLQATLDPESPLAVRLNEALDQFASTTQSIGELTDYLQQHPSSLIRGRYVPDQDH